MRARSSWTIRRELALLIAATRLLIAIVQEEDSGAAADDLARAGNSR